ncbi:chromatin modification-related protein EAF7-domain-containing protein [Paraphysoderma sedebokerense]|nr:chromatin modification-related protein EAF7-domain-containing protein [Paraphysoderma sedebokerense]
MSEGPTPLRTRKNSDISIISEDFDINSPEIDEDAAIEWTPKMEIVFFTAICRYRPIGIHKHFRMINIYRYFNKHSRVKVTMKHLWDRLHCLYDLEKIEARDLSRLDEEPSPPPVKKLTKRASSVSVSDIEQAGKRPQSKRRRSRANASKPPSHTSSPAVSAEPKQSAPTSLAATKTAGTPASSATVSATSTPTVPAAASSRRTRSTAKDQSSTKRKR